MAEKEGKKKRKRIAIHLNRKFLQDFVIILIFSRVRSGMQTDSKTTNKAFSHSSRSEKL
jgi:hypothetical protein